MSIDPKLVGGGAAVVAIGGGSGYAISQAVSSSNDNQNSSSQGDNKKTILSEEQKSQNKTTNKKALLDAGFQTDDSKENAGNCKTKLEEKELSSEDDFKAAVKECVVGKKFSDKASQMGLEVLTTVNLESWDNPSWWTGKKEAIKKIVTALATGKDNWSDAKTDLSNFCTKNEDKQGNKEINENINATDWTNFLTACTKDKTETNKSPVTVDSIKTKNFWTGK